MPSTESSDVVHSGFYGPGKSAVELRSSRKADRSRASTKKGKKGRELALGPTPERMAKGDVLKTAGMHRSVPPVERLRDQRKLGAHAEDARGNQAAFEAALKLNRHYQGCMRGAQAQDLNKILGAGASGDLVRDEAWVHNHDILVTAMKLIGWCEENPFRGAARIVLAVVCEEMTVQQAAEANLPPARLEVMKANAMDRLREGLFALARHWRIA